ncbi:MAG: CehA/McbA family metallohydrolase [Acidimicrobiales bacterium]
MLRRIVAALVTVLAAAAVSVPVAWSAPTASAPSCAPDGPTVTSSGHATAADVKTYLEVPFEVAAGTTRVELTYDWHDDDPVLPANPITQTVFDLGMWDNHGYRAVEGFRGWSGSRQGRVAAGQTPVFVQQDIAQRGYRPDPIEPGTWYAELGIAAVTPSPGGATWTITATCTAPTVGAPFVARPVDATHVANPAAGWYRGDMHMHGYHSNAHAPDWQSMVDEARAAGLDFLPITDYITNEHWRELGPVQDANPDMVIWPGREIITYFGHMNAIGETPDVIDYRQGFQDVSMREVEAATKADGALFQVNHPTTFPGPLFANVCRGCAFDLGGVIDWSQVDSMEVLTGPILAGSGQLGLPDLGITIQNPFTQPAIDLWVGQLMAGYKITGVSGSDSKGVEDPGQRWGTNATVVYADELSRPALQAGIEAGHVYVQTKGAHLSPELEMRAAAPDGAAAMFGDVLHADSAEMSVTVRHGQGQLLSIYRNADTLAVPVPITSDPFTYTFSAARSADEGPLGTFWRAETRDLQSLTTIGNPIFLDGPRSAGSAQRAPSEAAAGRPESGGGSGVGSLPATGADDDPRFALLALGACLAAMALRRRAWARR